MEWIFFLRSREPKNKKGFNGNGSWKRDKRAFCKDTPSAAFDFLTLLIFRFCLRRSFLLMPPWTGLLSGPGACCRDDRRLGGRRSLLTPCSTAEINQGKLCLQRSLSENNQPEPNNDNCSAPTVAGQVRADCAQCRVDVMTWLLGEVTRLPFRGVSKGFDRPVA
jgi:hypothetical protein